MPYLTCDDYDGMNSPERKINLRSSFVSVTEPPSYGNLTFPTGNTLFNGHAWMKFTMEMSSVMLVNGPVSTKAIGNWTADISAPIHVTSREEIANLSAAVVYRVFTVEVRAGFSCLIEMIPNSQPLSLS